MYYKIENKKCKVYKKLHALRTLEYKMKFENEDAIRKKIGFDLKWDDYLGYPGQRGFNRLPEFKGFAFKEPDKVDPSIWKLHPKENSIYIPNTRTKAGREMKQFLSSELQQSPFHIVFDILKLDYFGRFTIPYVEIFGETIVLRLDDNHVPKDKNVIEITSIEFQKFRQSKN